MKAQAIGSFARGEPAKPIRLHKPWTRYLVPAGRALFVAVFLLGTPGHFGRSAASYGADNGVPFADLVVPLSGLLALLGGLSVLLGYRTRLGAAMIAVYLVPVTLMMHRFWVLHDPSMVHLQEAMFLKNLALFGTALMLIGRGAGPVSFDAMSDVRIPPET